MHAADQDAIEEFTPPEILLAEEDELLIAGLDEHGCYRLGCWIAERALADEQPLALSIWLGAREVFRLKLPGSPQISDLVLDAKHQTASRGGHSSLYERNERLSRGTTFEADTGLTFPQYAPFGGAVPIPSSASGDVHAWVIVTGLSQEEDHAIAVEAIRAAASLAS